MPPHQGLSWLVGGHPLLPNDRLTAAGAGKLFADKISGSKRVRPELDRMLDQLCDGGVVAVNKYGRSARCRFSLRIGVSRGSSGPIEQMEKN